MDHCKVSLVVLLCVSGLLADPIPADKSYSDVVYTHCNEDLSNCVGAKGGVTADPKACLRDKTCDAVVSFIEQEGSHVFLVYAKQEYAGVGFSDDKEMGRDGTVMCVPLDATSTTSTEVKAYLAYNVGTENHESPTQTGLSDVTGVRGVEGGSPFIRCSFTLQNTVSYSPELTITLGTGAGYYLVVVAGQLEDDGAPGYHGGAMAISTEKLFRPDSYMGIYHHCNEQLTNCIGLTTGTSTDPTQCVREMNCKAIVAFGEIEGGHEFHVHAEYEYAGVGFSQDKEMGEDGAVMCVPKDPSVADSTEIKVFLAYNVDTENHVSPDQSGLSSVGGMREGGSAPMMHCHFVLQNKIQYSSEVTVSLGAELGYYLVLVAGGMKADGTPGYHDGGMAISNGKLFADEGYTGAAGSTHAALYLVSVVCLALRFL